MTEPDSGVLAQFYGGPWDKQHRRLPRPWPHLWRVPIPQPIRASVPTDESLEQMMMRTGYYENDLPKRRHALLLEGRMVMTTHPTPAPRTDTGRALREALDELMDDYLDANGPDGYPQPMPKAWRVVRNGPPPLATPPVEERPWTRKGGTWVAGLLCSCWIA